MMLSGAVPSVSGRTNGLLSVLRLLLAAVLHFALGNAAPIFSIAAAEGNLEGKSATDPQLWIYLAIAIALVLLGGAFAGLTIAYESSFLETGGTCC